MNHETCDCHCHHSSSFFSGIILGAIIGAIIAVIVYRQNKSKVGNLLKNNFAKILKKLNSPSPVPTKKRKIHPPKVFVRRTK